MEHPIHFKILSYQHPNNDMITLKLLDMTEQVQTEMALSQTTRNSMM